jgi:probable F420-dependent oxidoreductase
MIQPSERQAAARPLKVGLHLPQADAMMAGQLAGWRDIAALARQAEAVGFDSLWVWDHLLLRLPLPGPDLRAIGTWEGWSLLSALAATTERVELGLLVACASFRNPALLAKMADTVDEISGGRLILGLGAGWHEPEFHAFGYPFDHRVSRFEEALTIIRMLLREGHVDFAGTFYQARDCELRPRGPRPQGPPLLIGGEGERMLRLVARYADAWGARWTGSAAAIPPLRAAVDAACAVVGRDPATVSRTAAVFVDLPGSRPPSSGWDTAIRGQRGTVSGSPAVLAEALRAYAAEGISHVQVSLDPCTEGGVAAFAPVLELLDPS